MERRDEAGELYGVGRLGAAGSGAVLDPRRVDRVPQRVLLPRRAPRAARREEARGKASAHIGLESTATGSALGEPQ